MAITNHKGAMPIAGPSRAGHFLAASTGLVQLGRERIFGGVVTPR
jgi:hypothetical protein